MNIEKILTESFLEEARRQKITLTNTERDNLKKKFNLYAVQRSVDSDIEQLKREYRAYPSLQREEVRKRERYHHSNLRKLAQDYAKLLAEERITFITESKAEETRTMLKASAAKPCDAYPC